MHKFKKLASRHLYNLYICDLPLILFSIFGLIVYLNCILQISLNSLHFSQSSQSEVSMTTLFAVGRPPQGDCCTEVLGAAGGRCFRICLVKGLIVSFTLEGAAISECPATRSSQRWNFCSGDTCQGERDGLVGAVEIPARERDGLVGAGDVISQTYI